MYAYELKMQGGFVSPLQFENLKVLSENKVTSYIVTLLKTGDVMFETYTEYEERTKNYEKDKKKMQGDENST